MLAIEEEIFQASIARGVLLVKGTWFLAEPSPPAADTSTAASPAQQPPEQLFFRTTFAAVDEEKVMEAISRFGDALRGVFGLE